ncbi:MAG: hypothetical protein KDA24_06570 [Deltaproteobacteria bacterium]|nr:hypothetical protein [Deltaproteobacteria bacterium]
MRWSSLLALSLLLAGCPSDPDPVDDDDTIDEHEAQTTACDLAEGEATPVVASTGLDPDAESAMAIDGGPYLLDLVDGDHSWVSFDVGADDNEVIVFLGAPGVVENFWETDHVHTGGNPVPNPDCPDLIPEQHRLETHAGKWWVEIGVLVVDELWIHVGTGAAE